MICKKLKSECFFFFSFFLTLIAFKGTSELREKKIFFFKTCLNFFSSIFLHLQYMHGRKRRYSERIFNILHHHHHFVSFYHSYTQVEAKKIIFYFFENAHMRFFILFYFIKKEISLYISHLVWCKKK